jgi:dCTP deaminase
MNLIQRLNRLFYRPNGGLIPDWRIQQLVERHGMIEPFHGSKERYRRGADGDIIIRADGSPDPIISRGLGHYSYDLTLSPKEFLVFGSAPSLLIADPKDFNPTCLGPATLHGDEKGSFFILPAHTYALGFTVEYQRIPDNVTVVYIGKSTYARMGIIVNTTPGEASWEGHLTVEISNSSGTDVRIYVNEGICAALFFEGVQSNTTYGRGKYQGQGAGVVFARV